jgi:hypothetical protein
MKEPAYRSVACRNQRVPYQRVLCGCAMDKATEYRRNSEYCRQMAEGVQNEEERAQWLRLAQSWLRMIRSENHIPTGENGCPK